MPWVYTLTILDSPTGHLADGPSVLIPFFAVASLLLWGCAFLVQVVARGVVAIEPRKQSRWRWTWVAIPIIALAGWFAQGHGLVWKLRWWHAQDHFDAIRLRMASGGPPPVTPCWVGTFRVTAIQPWSAIPRLNTYWPQAPRTRVYWLSWPDTAYSDMTPAIINSPDKGIAGWPITEPVGNGWFACMDNT